MRSMRSTPTGGRPLPAFGYTGSIRAHSSRHGTTRSISARNCARRVVFVYFSKPVPASVICLRAIITSRGRPLPVSSQHVGLKRERVIQRFLKTRRLGWRDREPKHLGIGDELDDVRFGHSARSPGDIYRRVPVIFPRESQPVETALPLQAFGASEGFIRSDDARHTSMSGVSWPKPRRKSS